MRKLQSFGSQIISLYPITFYDFCRQPGLLKIKVLHWDVWLNWSTLNMGPLYQQPHHPAAQDRLPTEDKQGWVPGWETPEKTRLLLEEVVVRPEGGVLTLWSVWIILTPYSDGDTVMSKKAPSFGWGPDSLWSLKSQDVLRKRVGCKSTNPSRPNSPIGLHHGLLIIPIHWLASSRSPLHQYAGVSSRWMLHTGGGWGDSPLLCKALWVPRKVLYEYKELIT